MAGIITETLAPRLQRMAGLSGVNGCPLYVSGPTYTIIPYTRKQPIYNINLSSNSYNSNNRNTSSAQNYDEPDNKTNDQLLFPKTINRMNDIFHREDERLKTFDYWPLEWLDKQELARTGMFYTGEADKVKCYFCEVEIGRWEEHDMPLPEHLRWSPNCPLLRRRTTNNVPIDIEALDRILPPISYDLCGANDPIEVRPFAYSEGTINMTPRFANVNSLTSSSSSSSMGTNAAHSSESCTPTPTYYPEYPEYAIEAARVRSFAEWPRHMKQRPEQLSEAGFFYTGSGDRVKCFSCGGGLKDWDEHDDPWEQHALWLNKCRYLNLIKGQSYVESVLAKQKALEAEAIMKPMETVSHKPIPDTLMPEYTVAAAAATETETTTMNCDVEPTAQKSKDCLISKQLVAKEISVAAASAATSTNIPEEKLCKICYAGEYNTAFLPCGHVVACAKCASSVTKCPLCRKPFTDVMRVYFS